MNTLFAAHAREDYLFWQKTDGRVFDRINKLIKVIEATPFSGSGKPEPLKHGLAGYWSRRIDHQHRMVYRVYRGNLLIAQLRYRY